MKKQTFILFLTWMPLLVSAQNTLNQDFEGFFSAIIVKDFDISMTWYTDVLGFEVISKMESDDNGFKQANLKRGNTMIELIDLESSISLPDVIPDYNKRTYVVGLFKFGFFVSDFDHWIDHLTTSNVEFYGDVVTDKNTGKRMIIIYDPDGNRIQLFGK